jgi:hypothetical protein
MGIIELFLAIQFGGNWAVRLDSQERPITSPTKLMIGRFIEPIGARLSFKFLEVKIDMDADPFGSGDH